MTTCTMTQITDAELLNKQQIAKEELVAEFHVWLQSHFDSAEDRYINAVVELVDNDSFYALAEEWAIASKRNKLFY